MTYTKKPDPQPEVADSGVPELHFLPATSSFTPPARPAADHDESVFLPDAAESTTWTPKLAATRDLIMLALMHRHGSIEDPGGHAVRKLCEAIGLPIDPTTVKQATQALRYMEKEGMVRRASNAKLRQTTEVKLTLTFTPQQRLDLEADQPANFALATARKIRPPSQPLLDIPRRFLDPRSLTQTTAFRGLFLLALYDAGNSIESNADHGALYRLLELAGLGTPDKIDPAISRLLHAMEHRHHLIMRTFKGATCTRISLAGCLTVADAAYLRMNRDHYLGLLNTPPDEAIAPQGEPRRMSVVDAYKIVALLELHVRGPLDDSTGYATRELLVRAGQSEALAPTSMQKALKELADRELINRDTGDGDECRTYRIALSSGLKLSGPLLSWLKRHERIALELLRSNQPGLLHSRWPLPAQPTALSKKMTGSEPGTQPEPAPEGKAEPSGPVDVDEIDQLASLVRAKISEVEHLKAEGEAKVRRIAKLEAEIAELRRQQSSPVTSRYPDLAPLLQQAP